MSILRNCFLLCAFTIGAPAFADDPLPTCTKKHQLDCHEECRTLFDAEFHRCSDECLAKVCVKEQVREAEQVRSADEALTCIEFESSLCAKRCGSGSSESALRCRRSCLQERCEKAYPSDIASEALDPGNLRCKRCRDEERYTCQRRCRLGIRGRNSGLGQIGCESACLSTNCSSSCGLRIF